ncbi:Co2+/Mg2+ efflux protein ApaG [Catenovulum maritimum]|uniref:Protein ApaG n=1 Tax=Catenovulum maritimum TaxID=1513271 RepID=A0A0J8GU32_9ALTE|nr:Co2+/Mg2+ efflux protein ApaG [Catenovulum maritimum]KMT66275.1 heavy metal transporter [Catenovulum maritimum]
MSQNNLGDKVLVSVSTQYVDDQSDPAEERFVFTYSITIHNTSDIAVKLKSRYWLITDSNGKKVEVQGDGVIGQQPILKPDAKFHYTSGAVVETPVATMEGYYVMINKLDETEFHAPINVFRLAQPNILN